MPWTTPETFTAGQTLTAASMNALSGNDAMLADIGSRAAWTEYTVTASGGSITAGTGGTVNGRWFRVGRLIIVQAGFSLGTGGSLAAGPISLSVPVAAATTARPQIGSVWMYDQSAAAYAFGVCELQSGASTVQFRNVRSGGTFDGLGGANPWTWAANDGLTFAITYEAAS